MALYAVIIKFIHDKLLYLLNIREKLTNKYFKDTQKYLLKNGDITIKALWIMGRFSLLHLELNFNYQPECLGF